MNNRIKSLLEILNKKGMDAIIIYGEMNRRYLSGFTGSSGYLYISKNRRVMLTDFRYIEQAGKQCEGFEIIDHGSLGVIKTFAQIISEDGTKTIGFEANSLTYIQYLELEKGLVNINLMAVNDIVEKIRMIKDEDELENIKKAAEIADQAFEHILSFIKIGVPEKDIALEFEYFMKKQGAKNLSFDTIIASGKNSSLPHAEPTDKKIEAGDFLTMDFGCIYNGYCSDMTRTVVVGKADEKQKEIYNTVKKAQEEALAAIKAGLTGAQVDKVARDIIYGAGYSKNFGHGLGHSVGLEVHENPRFSPKDDTIIKPNMIMTVEPGIYIPDFGGVRIEDLVRITEEGYENFTHSDKSLIEL